MSYRILQGDCLDTLRTLPDESVHCCVTSPPYYGLRAYLPDGHADKGLEIGTEQTPAEYVAKLVQVFREVWRVLRPDATLWLNLGDSYNGSGGAGRIDGLKPKDLIGIPWRVAFALQADGWWLRSDCIWHKPNPMPESVTDRPTKAHEYFFLLAKSQSYFYDAEAVREPLSPDTLKKNGIGANGKGYPVNNRSATPDVYGIKEFTGNMTPGARRSMNPNGANRRSVWTVATSPYSEAHFATFPPALIEPCILAGCPVGGTVLDPFAGSGTTLATALKHGRAAIGCELNPDYVSLIHKRIGKTQPMLPMELQL